MINPSHNTTASINDVPDREKDFVLKIDMHKIYRKPCLKNLGDLRAITLGGSPGGPDESGPLGQHVYWKRN